MHVTLPAKNAHAPVHARLSTVQKLLCHRNFCELILSLVRASCRLSFVTRPAAVSTKSVASRWSLKKTVRIQSLKKTVQIHASSCRRYTVAQASFDHPRWCRPHPVCLWFAHEAWPRSSSIKEFYFRHFRAIFFDLRHALVRYLISCVQSSMSSPLHHLSYRRLCVLICLQAPVSFSSCFGISFSAGRECCPSLYCIPHAIIKRRMTILISYFPCLAAWFFPREYCSIRPLASLFAYLRI